jgi:N-acetylmuramoyl-L-alanine amidase CwlA
LAAYDLEIDAVKKHEDFSGKHCPDLLLSAGRWEEFVEMVKLEMEKE